MEGLISLLIHIVIIAIVIGVIVWAIQHLFPGAPAILVNGLYVIGVLLVLLILIRALGSSQLGVFRF